jgi:predicted acetyltransferase
VDIEVRTLREDEWRDWCVAVPRAFGKHPTEEDYERYRPITEIDRSLVCMDGTRIVGTTGAFSLSLTVPGGQVPMAGVTAVGVSPTHRRRGLLTTMMRRQLDDVHKRGECVAGLWASEAVIYQRFGYGLGAAIAGLDIERRWTGFLIPAMPAGDVELIEKAEALEVLPGVYDRARVETPGFWGRTPAWWNHLYEDPESERHGASALFYAVHRSSGQADGYAAYRIKTDWSSGSAGGTVDVKELVAATPEAYAALWRYCFDIDLIERIEAWPRSADEPLFNMMANPRQLKLKLADGLWVRLVDVAQALQARRYAAEARVVFEVRDSFCPWNEGRVALEGGADGAECTRTGREPDLVVDVRDLGAAYLGGTRFDVLARAGRVVESTPGALRRADAMFTWSPAPWCPAIF